MTHVCDNFYDLLLHHNFNDFLKEKWLYHPCWQAWPICQAFLLAWVALCHSGSQFVLGKNVTKIKPQELKWSHYW